MAACCYLPALCTAPKPFLDASRVSSQTISTAPAATATACRRRRIEATGDCTEHSAWTSIRQERWEGDLAVQGHIPAWVNGTYLRNGPGVWEVGDHAFDHVFDGYATLVRVSFRGARGNATGAHRQIESDAYKAARARGRPRMLEFSQLCPSEPGSLIERLRHAVELASGAALSDNANTAVVPLGDGRVVCLSEVTKSSVLVDTETLGTVGKLRFADDRLLRPVQCTHPVVVTTTGAADEVLTLLPDFARPGYVVARMAAGSGRRDEVIGRVPCRGGTTTPAWVHSFAVTENYIVVPEMPLLYAVAQMLMSERTPWYILDWLPDSGSYMHVVCRSTGNTVASVEVPPFVSFHFINAYEEKGDDGARAGAVIADCREYYSDPAIIKALALHRLRSPESAKDFPDSRVARFRIPLDGSGMGDLETLLDPDEHGRGVELSTINPAYVGKEYRYMYASSAHRPCNFFSALTKMDLMEKEVRSWHEEGTVPSEPFFVARPGATNNEDDGVVISIASTMDGDGYVLLLDAATFKEIARLQLPYGLPFGFHGCWIPDNNRRILSLVSSSAAVFKF